MKLCFVCETPFHVLNSLNYIAHQEEFSDAQIDFYIGKKFFDCENMAKRLRDIELIHRVYTYSMGPQNISFAAKLKATVMPKHYIADCVDGKFAVKTLDYDYVHFAFFGPMPYAMVFANKKAKVRYFEDGVGTYIGNIVTDVFTPMRKVLYRLTGTDYTRLYKPEAIFVNNKAMYKQPVVDDVRQFMPFTQIEETFLKQLFYVFDYKANPIYAERKCVYLSRPNDAHKPEIDALDKQVEDILSQFSDEFVLRMHPRQKDFRVGQMLPDTSRTSWELLCIDEITEDHILVGWFSTAQVIPKFILDKEPWLVFYYPIYQKDPKTADPAYERFDQMIDELKRNYRRPEKIRMIDSVERIPVVLEEVLKGAQISNVD